MTVEHKSRRQDLKRAIKALAKCNVRVGIPAESGERADGAPNNAVLGYLHEYGQPERNIPARPWLVPGVEGEMDKIGARLAKGSVEAIRAAMTGPQGERAGRAVAERTLDDVGLMAVSAVRARIVAGIAPPLSARTVYARLHRKKGRRTAGKMTPLIDSGQFLKAVTYIVET